MPSLIHAPWLSWLQRPTVILYQESLSEGREFEPHWGSLFLRIFFSVNYTLAYSPCYSP